MSELQMPEAGAVLNVKMIDPFGQEVIVTMRAILASQFTSLTDAYVREVQKLLDNGWEINPAHRYERYLQTGSPDTPNVTTGVTSTTAPGTERAIPQAAPSQGVDHIVYSRTKKTITTASGTERAIPQAAPSQGAEYRDFDAEEILMNFNDKGLPIYKIKGGPFKQWGVVAWPEVLPSLDIDATQLKPGPNVLVNLKVRALMIEGKAKKIVGRA